MVPGCLVCPGGEGGARVDVLPGTVGEVKMEKGGAHESGPVVA